MELLNEVEVFDRILKGEAPPVVQIGWGVLDASQGERLNGTIGIHHHSIHHFLLVKPLRLEVVHAVIGIVGCRVAVCAPALAVKERTTIPQLLTNDVQVGLQAPFQPFEFNPFADRRPPKIEKTKIKISVECLKALCKPERKP